MLRSDRRDRNPSPDLPSVARPDHAGSAARRSPGISPCRTTPTTCAGSASPRRISPSNALVDALVAWGDEDAVRGRVLEHLEAGADHVCIQPIGHGSDSIGIEQLRRLGPALLDL